MSSPLDTVSRSYTEYLYLTAVSQNFTGGEALASAKIERNDGTILSGSHHYKVGIKKFSINALELPLWQPQLTGVGLDTDCSITFYDTGAGTAFTDSIALPTAGFVFNTWADVVEVINICLTNVNTLAGGAFSAPTISYSNGIFTMNTVAGFRGTFEIWFNQPLYQVLNTFPIDGLNVDDADNDQYARLDLTTDAVAQTEETSLYFSPVDELIITTTLPVVPNLLPLIGTNSSDNYEKILADFKVFNSNAESNVFSYQFTTNGDEVNYHTMFQDISLKQFNLRFKWVDYTGVPHDIYLKKGQSAKAQVVFKRLPQITSDSSDSAI